MKTLHGTFLTAKELARRWKWNVGSLANLRAKKKGPPFIRVGRQILYPLRTVEEFEQERAETSRARVP